MKKNVGILIFDNAEVLDFAGPFEVFSVTSSNGNDKDFNVFTISHQQGTITAVNGLKVVPNFSIDEHPPIDILVLAGGVGTKKLLDEIRLHQWLLETHKSTVVTVSICSATRLLGKLGLLDNKPFCTHHDVYAQMEEIAPLAIPQREMRFVKTDERLFTSGGISAGIDLSFHIIDLLLGSETGNKTAAYMEYNRQLTLV